jgi:Protein of unknown function (DUF3667)
LEAAGDLMTGAVLGRAVEPEAGEGRGVDQGACLNCGVELIGPHCHGCGQKAKLHRTLRAYGHDLLHGVFHFDGKVWKTLPMLAFKPGELTRRYIHGERAKFVSPLALFLFAVFMMFAVVGGLAGEMHVPEKRSITEMRDKLKGKPLGELDAQRKQQQQRKDALDAQIKKIDAADGDTKALEKQSDAIEKEIDDIDFARGLLKGESWKPINGNLSSLSGWPQLAEKIKAANDNPNLFLYKLQSSAYKYSWALIPLSVPFVWLLFFWKRQFKLYDHAIFVTYSLTFMLFLTVVLVVAGFLWPPDDNYPLVPIAGTFVPPLHIYKQLRGAYQVSRFGAVLRTFALATFGTIVLSFFLLLLLVVGVL